jgi:ATP phosphoribosyltransferase regulatory subunit
MTGNMKYYTGMIFKSYAQGASEVVISGGRYDDLLGELGVNTTAAGFAVYIDNLMAAAGGELLQQTESKLLVVFGENRFHEALEFAEECRRKGRIINVIYSDDAADAEQYQKQYGYDEIIRFE